MNKRTFFSVSRLLHIYMSTALFSLLIFFSVTGITLNHLDWVSSKNVPQQYEGVLPTTTLANFTPPVSEPILNWFKQQHNLPTAKSIEWDDAAKELMLDYAQPAGFAYVIIDISTGHYSIDYQTGTVWQVANDLHKGRHSGPVWSWLIDISAVFMVLFSITGLIILWQNRPKRQMGIVLTMLGTFTPIGLFVGFVPYLSGI